MSHTPGPWAVGDKRGVWVGPVVMANDGQRGVAFVCGESDANARLIAAAPDLLEACDALFSRLLGYANDTNSDEEDREEQDDAALELAEAALIKAGVFEG